MLSGPVFEGPVSGSRKGIVSVLHAHRDRVKTNHMHDRLKSKRGVNTFAKRHPVWISRSFVNRWRLDLES